MQRMRTYAIYYTHPKSHGVVHAWKGLTALRAFRVLRSALKELGEITIINIEIEQ